jgi:putative acetyltransferase
MEIIVDDLTGSEIAEFLEEHIEEMKAVTPPESKHAVVACASPRSPSGR